MDPEVIPELGRLAASDKPGVAKAAREALQTLVHARRGTVATQVLALTGTAYALPVRAFAFRLLSLIGGDDAVPAVARYLRDPELREEAAFCLERIPGAASIKALAAAYKDAPDDFKPRLLAGLGHRRAAEALPVVIEALRSSNPEIALAATKAYGRIGKKPASPPRLPDASSLSEWQKIEHLDSLLRWADAQVREGNHADALKIYQTALARPEEHWQCAALIGIAKLGTAEAAAVIFPKLKSPHPKVRITARQAWQSLAGV
jgi:HEAT repeat protein